MSDLVEFLRKRFDEDEQAALDAIAARDALATEISNDNPAITGYTPAPWSVGEEYPKHEGGWPIQAGTLRVKEGAQERGMPLDVVGPDWEGGGAWRRETAIHIARWDPARVLREVEAKRRIIEEFRWWWDREPTTETDAELHARCAHPDYEYATTEGQRKAWPDCNVPPYDPETLEPDTTWERNVDAGIKGWERFDYTEESYWRRRLPEDKARQRHEQREKPPTVLRLLALPYADHPDYREEWRP